MARKEINLSSTTIKKLQKLADRDKRKLKPYMEKVLEAISDGVFIYIIGREYWAFSKEDADVLIKSVNSSQEFELKVLGGGRKSKK